MRRQHETGTLQTAVMIACLAVCSVGASEVPQPTAGNARPNDPLLPKQEALFHRVNAFEAWKVTEGDPNVWVGVIDTGFDFFHPDLKASLVPGFYADGSY